MSKHSSGRWTMSDHGEEITIDCGDIYGAAVLPAHNDDFPHDEQLANAQVMVAATSLLAACRAQILEGHTIECTFSQNTDRRLGRSPRCIDSCTALRAAIAKTQG